MLADKEKAAENTLCILKGFDAVMRAFPPGRTACALVNRRYHNAKSGTTYNAVPLLSSDLPPGERTGCGLDDRPRKGRNERERNNWRFCLSCFVRLSVYYRKSALFS